MKFESKFDLGQRLYYMHESISSKGEILSRFLSWDAVEAIIVEFGLLGKIEYKYNFGGRVWYDEAEVFETEAEARAWHGLEEEDDKV